MSDQSAPALAPRPELPFALGPVVAAPGVLCAVRAPLARAPAPWLVSDSVSQPDDSALRAFVLDRAAPAAPGPCIVHGALRSVFTPSGNAPATASTLLLHARVIELVHALTAASPGHHPDACLFQFGPGPLVLPRLAAEPARQPAIRCGSQAVSIAPSEVPVRTEATDTPYRDVLGASASIACDRQARTTVTAIVSPSPLRYARVRLDGRTG